MSDNTLREEGRLTADLRQWGTRYKRNLHASFYLTETGRDYQIDAMKGVAIILVLLGHVITPGFLDQLVYSFHMPLFFFLSGYIAYVSVRKYKPGELLFRRVKSLLVPFFFMSLVFDLVYNVVLHGASLSAYLRNIALGGPYWFLWALFLCFLALAAAEELEKRIGVVAYPIVLVVVMAVLFPIKSIAGQTSLFGLAYLRIFLIFFFAGFLLSKYRGQSNELLARYPVYRKILIGISLGAFPLFIVLGLLSKSMHDSIFIPYSITPTFTVFAGNLQRTLPLASYYYFQLVIEAFLGIAFVYCSLRLIKRGIHWLAWIGFYAIDIYILHSLANYFAMRWVINVLAASRIGKLAVMLVSWQVFVILLTTVVGLAFALFLSIFIVRRNKVLKFLFLGKSGPSKPDDVISPELPTQMESASTAGQSTVPLDKAD